MHVKKQTITGIAVSLALVSMIGAGCANTAKNKVQQQGVKMQAQNLPPATADNRIQIANQAADKITKVPGVKTANVLVTRNNAYVAAAVNTNQGQLTPDLEKQIADQARATDPNIRNVYVSTNPEFVDRVNRYVADVRAGHPVAGFANEFTQIVQRVFPNAR